MELTRSRNRRVDLESENKSDSKSVGLGSWSPNSVLVVEDDESLRPFWDYVVEQVNPRLKVQWVASVSGAEQFLRNSEKKQSPLGLVIADIYLQGQRTGVDLWREFRSQEIPFLMTSGMSQLQFRSRFAEQEEAPPYLEKPLDLEECVETVRLVLEMQSFSRPGSRS